MGGDTITVGMVAVCGSIGGAIHLAVCDGILLVATGPGGTVVETIG